jgi:hypothetical protein
MIQNSNTEHAYLKSSGPFKIINSGVSIAGVVMPQGLSVSKSLMYGDSKVYGQRIAGKEELSIERDDIQKPINT